jgi:hypothetical protein
MRKIGTTPGSVIEAKPCISTRSAIAMLAVSFTLAICKAREWPITVELSNWRGDVIYSALLYCTVGLASILVARAIPWGLLRAFAYQAGGLMVIGVLLVQASALRAPDKEFLAKYDMENVHYHLYADDSIGAAILTREWGPIFGLKLTSAVWANSDYCCALSIVPNDSSHFTVVDKYTRVGLFTFPSSPLTN